MKTKLPNIILIVMDTVGAKHMSLYGYHRRTTPYLERLGDECTLYNRCFAPSCWTIPSHASMFTGLFPSQHGAYEGKYLLEDDVQHLVPALNMMGYRCFGISSNGLVSPTTGLARGFDYFYDFSGSHLEKALQSLSDEGQPDLFYKSGELAYRLDKGLNSLEKVIITLRYIFEKKEFKGPLKRAVEGFKFRIRNMIKPNPFIKSSVYTEKTIKLFSEITKSINKTGAPFFIFMNFMDGHEKYRPPFRFRNFSGWYDKQLVNMEAFYLRKAAKLDIFLKMNRNLYDDAISYLDNRINMLWNICKQFSNSDNTVFIVTSDHGEHFGEKDLFGHNLSLYNELTWVPLLIRFPQGLIPSGLDDRLVSLNDIYSTILDLAGSPLPRPTTSLSLLGTTKRELTISQYIYPEGHKIIMGALQKSYSSKGSSFSPPIMAIITSKGNKFIEKRDGSYDFYDLNNDMDEKYNLSSKLQKDKVIYWKELVNSLLYETGYFEAYSEVNQLYQHGKVTTELGKYF